LQSPMLRPFSLPLLCCALHHLAFSVMSEAGRYHLSDTSAIEVRKRSLRDSFAGAFRYGEGGVGDLVASFLAATASSSARSFPLL
jgi:hypothetical protein